ncbi:MAP kinase-activating death domain protein [Fasciola hepatica]|uniref:MAP kinase-activating death domain protein n=1 Tax=Fasciola hepatica TaxID=6192 RepID=A0A4E0R1L6_FASHE|nr:MAP kinase-activating death domain protein [Fasciola hepatica]
MSVSRDFCPRFVDYIVLVGSHSSNRTSYAVQNPVILNRFPPLDHDDFILPPDVALFCQPDGCYNSCGPHAPKIPHQSLPGRSPVSFVFTITDKESSKTRYGICLNFMRPIRRRRGSRKQSTSLIEDQLKAKFQRSAVNTGTNSHSSCLEDNTRMSISNDSSKGTHVSRLRTHTLTSLCIITHHPFFSKFRAVLEFLQKLIQKVHERSRSEVPEGESIWGVLTGAITSVSSPLVARSVREIEVWILKLLSAPAPIPGRTCLHLSLQPKSLSDPLVFALPDKSRLPLVDFPLHLPIQLMGISRTLRILVCLLLEQKVVLQSADYNKLSLCVLAFTALLYPLQYMFPVIPLLPPCMADAEQLLIAPTPYIIGVPTSFYSARKVFRMPKDVWLANLDTQELSYPEVLEEIPDLPEPECNNLIKQLNHALSTLPSVSSDTSLDLALYQVNQLFRNPAAKSLTGYNPLSYISDEASTSVATRVSMVLFLLTKNILGGLSEYTRTLRLYPRPVVAFQFERFMRSRPRPCLFTSMLAKTQAVEYFAECSLCSQNEAYQRIEAGDYTPELIGDKAEWFSSFLQNVHFDVWPDSTADSPSNFGRLNTCAGSPLLYALVAARLQYNSQFASPENSDAVGLSSGDLKLDVTRDDLSDYPTDESASDTETEHSTASIGSTLSDVTSDCVDSGIGEPQNKGNDAGVRLNIIIVRTDSVVSARRDSDPSVAEQLFVRAGEPLPSSLADYFNPPLAPVLNKLPSVKGNEIIVCIPAMQGSDHSANELEVDKEDIISTTSGAKSDSSRSFKPSTPSTEQTLRAVARISANMFNASSNRNSDGDRANPSVLSDGGINWNSSLFKLVNELLHLSTFMSVAPCLH